MSQSILCEVPKFKTQVRTSFSWSTPSPRSFRHFFIVEPDEDGGYVIESASIEGVVSQGETPEEALANAIEAVKLHRDACVSQGIAVKRRTERLAPVEGQFELTATLPFA